MGKSIEAVKALLEEMVSNNYHWSSERATPRRSGGIYDTDTMSLLASRIDTLAQRLDIIGTSPTPGGSSRSSVGGYAICETCGVQGQTSTECHNGPLTIEQANAVSNSYPNAHNPGVEELL